ncbi:FAD-dependent oxidoreductase [Adhaeretor mobilis]|uniref:Choline dehydrogenase n=1 Tax=Adhaeretor mobilis TaxID=1930276 RepID=A0A517MYP6_9BACT|nr:FAD-dependent oxidoreductase [Adhaeretor mobilis]QDS99989.1 choline dehydrogenase [Adhaeretor mobilis]
MLFEDTNSLADQTFDPNRVVIIGAGTVGIHLAVQLARQGRSSLVLESGDQTLGNYSSDSYAVVGRKNEGIRLGRSVALGGTSNLWGGQLVEFNPTDLNGRHWLEGSKWPISYEELAAYYPATYDSLGIDTSLQNDEDVWRELGTEPPVLGEGTELFLSRWMRIPNIAALFRHEIETNPKLQVVLNATVTGFEGNGSRITGVQILSSNGQREIMSGCDFVLSAGTVENSRLLLHTASDPTWQCPWRENDNVGRYFQDHIGGRVAMIKPRNTKNFYDLFSTIVLRGHKFQPKIRLQNELLVEQPTLNTQAWIAFENSIKENFVFLKQFFQAAVYSRKIGSLGDFLRNVFACSRHMIPLMWKYVVEHRILIPSGSRIALTVQSEVEPLRESRITIDPNTCDEFGLPQAILDWNLGGREFEYIMDFTRRIDKALRDSDLGELVLDEQLAAGDPSFLDKLHDTNHHSGGCVMADSAEQGVVDLNLKVFGTDNLYANGACVFRTNSNANCTFTAMALATRLADHLGVATDATG